MASTVICGRCGTTLPGPSSTCPTCGTRSSAGSFANGYATRQKSPWLAAALSVIPGLGHLYLGHYRKGMFYLVAASGLEFFGFDLDLTAIGAVLGIPMELGGAGLWLHSAWDAYHLAKRGDYR
jgi:TM2 domain-containing membrane protein YozV